MKKIIGILLGFIVLLGVSGCMKIDVDNVNTDKQKESEQIGNTVLEYLKEKYDENFEILLLKEEFSGNRGMFYRVVCKSTSRPEPCLVYCHTDDSDEGTKVEINGRKYMLTDDYANIILQEEYSEHLQEVLGDDVLVQCQLHIPNHMLTNEEFEKGLKECLENTEQFPRMYVYVLTDINQVGSGLRESAEQFMEQYNVYVQYLYLGYQKEIDLEKWKKLYYENYTSFERYLIDKSQIERVEFSLFSRDTGLGKKTVVKE